MAFTDTSAESDVESVLTPACVPKPSRPGPGRPLGSKNRKPAPRHDVGKSVKRETTLQVHLAARG